MKLAYLYYFSSKTLPIGIYNKIKGQANAAKDLNLDISFIVLNREKNINKNNIELKKINLPSKKTASYLKRKFFKYKTIDENIDLSAYDKIIFRYPLANDLFFYNRFWEKNKSKIITIHNSNEIEELKSKKTFKGKIDLILEKKNSSKILTKIIGLIAVSDEIRKAELRKIKINKPSIVVANGVDVDNISFTKYKPVDNNSLNLIFLSSVFQPWQGLGRLLQSLDNYHGRMLITVFIIGKIQDDADLAMIEKFSNPKVHLKILKNKYGSELDHYFMNSTLAIGPLELYKKNMEETSALKLVEYTARGIPFIYAYNDNNIDKDCNFALRFENNSKLIDISSIIKFAQNVSSQKNISQEMRNYAFHKLDWKIKIKEMYNFAQGL